MRHENHILFLLSAASTLELRDGSRIPSGFWAEELLVPWNRLRQSGWSLRLATPNGTVPQVDPESLLPDSLNGGKKKAARLTAQLAEIGELQHPLDLRQLHDQELDNMLGAFIPGGNGPLTDIAQSPEVARLICHCSHHKKPLATLCHGSAALLATSQIPGFKPYLGRTISCFSAAEEAATALAGRWPYTLENALRQAGFRVSVGEPWRSHVVSDGLILSGQNPASALALTEAFMQTILFHIGKENT